MTIQSGDAICLRSAAEDGARLAMIEAAVRRLPEVTDVTVILKAEPRTGEIENLVPGHHERTSTPFGDPLVNPETASPSMVWGKEIQPGDRDAPRTLREALESTARTFTARGITYLDANGGEDYQTYAELLGDARRLLSGLHSLGLKPGDSVLFQLASNRNIVTVFWACLLGGFLPTPVSVAPGYTADNAVTRTLHNAWRLLDQPPIVTEDSILGVGPCEGVRGLAALWGVTELRVATVRELAGSADTSTHQGHPDDVVLNLLTSGSTGVPKCVQHTNRSLLARIRATAAATGLGPDDVGLNWMPLDHVGGIVMSHLRDVVLGCHQVSANIETFLGRPIVLLDWIERYRATNTWAPNFAFALINEYETEIAQASWDLSSMRHMCNAGEAVVASVAHRFLRLLSPHGLAPDVMYPCWGMSETSSGVTFSRLDRDDESVGTVRVDARSLGGQLRITPAPSPYAVTFTEVGPPIPGVGLRIVDSAGAPLPEGTVGSLQVRGNTMMAGYFRNPAANRDAFTSDGWFRTGDLGFLRAGRLTITGREKDVIIVGGANYINSEIESVIERVEGVRVTYAAACALPDPRSGTDQLGVFFTPVSDDPGNWPSVVRAIRTRLSREVGLVPCTVVPLPGEKFPKTSSGKIQRAQLVRELKSGEFDRYLQRLASAEASEVSGSRFHTVTWRPTATAEAPYELPHGPWLVVGGRTGDGGLPAALAQRLPDRHVAVATAGGDALTIALAHPPTVVIYLAGLPASPPTPDTTSLGSALDDIVFSLLRLIQALPSKPYPEIIVATTQAVWARAGDRVDCAKTALPGLVRTARAEAIPMRQVDLPVAGADAHAEILIGEVRRRGINPLVAYRDGIRLTPRLRSVVPDITARPAVEVGGRYLLTGGLGGIGFELAQYLLAAYQAKLLIIGRTPLHTNSENHQRYEQLRELGDVRYSAADVADTDAVGAAVRDAEMHWAQPLTGILHLAGADVSMLWDDLEKHRLVSESAEEFWRTFRPKVFGTWVLRDLLAERPDTPLVLFSSVNGFFGGTSFGAYAAASSFLDGFADHWGRELGRPVRCLAWSAWADIGMNRANPAAVAAAQRGFRTITPDEGLASFLSTLSLDRVHVLVGLDPSASSVQAQLDPSELRSTEAIVAYTASADLAPGAVERAVAETDVDVTVRCIQISALPYEPSGGIDQPRLQAELVRANRADQRSEEPVTDLERRLAGIWEEALGAGFIGRRETFFELGGTSLRAAELVTKINRVLGTALSTRELYEHPTIASLANVLA